MLIKRPLYLFIICIGEELRLDQMQCMIASAQLLQSTGRAVLCMLCVSSETKQGFLGLVFPFLSPFFPALSLLPPPPFLFFFSASFTVRSLGVKHLLFNFS